MVRRLVANRWWFGFLLALAAIGIWPTRMRMVHATDPAMVGYLDGTTQVNGQTNVVGWACFQGSTAAVDVHVYAGGPFGIGDRRPKPAPQEPKC
jgi:hypothetical protein